MRDLGRSPKNAAAEDWTNPPTLLRKAQYLKGTTLCIHHLRIAPKALNRARVPDSKKVVDFPSVHYPGCDHKRTDGWLVPHLAPHSVSFPA